MGLLAVLALGIAAWAIATGRIRKPDNREAAALALGAIGLAMLVRGKVIPAIAFLAGGAALWPWRGVPPTARAMNIDEARALLGVPADADAETVRAAHRRLIAQTHPDRGGTEELARQINLARDTALSAISNKR